MSHTIPLNSPPQKVFLTGHKQGAWNLIFGGIVTQTDEVCQIIMKFLPNTVQDYGGKFRSENYMERHETGNPNMQKVPKEHIDEVSALCHLCMKDQSKWKARRNGDTYWNHPFYGTFFITILPTI